MALFSCAWFPSVVANGAPVEWRYSRTSLPAGEHSRRSGAVAPSSGAADVTDSVPVCSVIVVSHNSGAALVDCVGSVLDSTVAVRLLLSDNDSSDGSVDLVRSRWGSDDRLVIEENGANLGFSRACNRILHEASGEWLLFLNPDCFLEPDTLERMLAVVSNRPGVGMAGCLLRNPDGSEQAGCRRREPTPLRSLARVLRLPGFGLWGSRPADFDLVGTPIPSEPEPVEAISGAFMLVRRAALQQVGLLDEGFFLHCEDLDWCRRFRDAGHEVLFVPSVEVLHVKGVSSRARPVRVEWHKHRGMLRYYRKHFREQYPSPLMWVVWAAVWTRFGLLAAMLTLRRVFT